MMDSPTRRLRQQRATLTAVQGDPQFPIGGTLYARLCRLRSEMQQALLPIEHDPAPNGHADLPLNVRGGSRRHVRALAAIQAEIRGVHAELRTIQDDIDRIDALIAAEEGKPPR